jgi:hypothetical protein
MAGAVSRAQARVQTVAGAFKVLGSTPIIGSSDVIIGYRNPLDQTGTPPNPSAAISTYNAVQVFVRRDATHGGPVTALFAMALGKSGFSLSVSSTATVVPTQPAAINAGAHLLPIVLSKTNYNAMMADTTSDQYSFNPTTKQISAGSDGIPESCIYPIKNGSEGNFGTINIGVSNNSTATLSSQIANGITASQVAAEFPNNGNILDKLDTSTTPPTPYHTFSGNPGISSGIKTDLTNIIGEAVTIPIYDQIGGNGNNATYRVVTYLSGRLMYVNFQGNPKYVIVQPATPNDPAIRYQPEPNWSTASSISVSLTE